MITIYQKHQLNNAWKNTYQKQAISELSIQIRLTFVVMEEQIALAIMQNMEHTLSWRNQLVRLLISSLSK